MFIGSVTDPYNPQEEIYKRTRTLLEELKGSGVKLSISTKSDLILRDLDLIKTFPNTRVSWSINTLDENFRADMDNAVSIEQRLTLVSILSCRCAYYLFYFSDISRNHGYKSHHPAGKKSQCNLIWLEISLQGGFKSPAIMNYSTGRNTLTAFPLY